MNQSKFAHSRTDIIDANGFDVPDVDQEWYKKDSSNYSTLEEEEYFLHIEANQLLKQERYKDANGEDWIDECARTLTPEEFRGAMKFNIGKYNRRAGKKDALIKEIEKIKDYADRWIRYENERL